MGIHNLRDVAHLMGSALTDADIRAALKEAIEEATTGPDGAPGRHLKDGQSGGWDANSSEYNRRKGSRPLFVKTGQARAAALNPHHALRKTTIRRLVTGVWSATTEIVKRDAHGRNVYTFAQGKRRGRTAGGRAKRPMNVMGNQPGDEVIIKPHLERALMRRLERRGF